MIKKYINLLPKEDQHQLMLRSWYRALMRLYMFGAASFLLVALLCGGVWWYLRIAQNRLAAEAESLRVQSAKQETADLKKQIRIINAQIVDYNTLVQEIPKWSHVLSRFAELVPRGLQIQNFAVDNAKRQISIGGFSPTRELVISLYNNIAKDAEYFEGINYPLENVSKPTNITFNYTFTVKEKVLQ